MIRSLTLRILAIYLPLDLFFSTALCLAHLGLFDLEHAGPYMVAFAALWPFRFFGWAVLVASSLKPVSALALAGRRATDQEVATAEEALRLGRSRLPVIYGLGWFTHLALATLYMAWLYPEPEAVSAYSLEASLLLVLGVLAGALVFTVPLFLVLINGEATSLSLESQMRGIEPRIGQSSLQHRITALALGLGIAPTLFVASLGYSSAGLAELELLGRDATSAALELATAAAGEERVSPVEERHRAGAVMRRAEGITGPVAALASSSPVLAKALEDAVRQGKALSRVDRGAGVAIAAPPVDGDRVAVAVLRTSRERVSSFLIAAVAFVLTVLAWAPISAAMFSRSITVPIAHRGGAEARRGRSLLGAPRRSGDHGRRRRPARGRLQSPARAPPLALGGVARDRVGPARRARAGRRRPPRGVPQHDGEPALRRPGDERDLAPARRRRDGDLRRDPGARDGRDHAVELDAREQPDDGVALRVGGARRRGGRGRARERRAHGGDHGADGHAHR